LRAMQPNSKCKAAVKATGSCTYNC
jgi:hypothetical protein